MRLTRAVGLSAALALSGPAVTACGGGAEAEQRPAKSSAASPSAPAPSSPAPVTEKPAPEAALLKGAARVVRPEIAPADGETVGVGQPLAIVFKQQKVSKELRAGIEGRLKVSTSPQVPGAWHWNETKGDTRVHFRPEKFWPAGTRVTLDARLAGVKLAEGTAATGDRTVSFTIGDSMVSTVDLKARKLTVVRNGKTLRTIPVSGGDESKGFGTREGIKTILAKEGKVVMDSLSIGIPRNHPDGFYGSYEYSMRETVSGEFVHAAPDNAESFGKENVSHGCIGMSTDDAKWLYGLSLKGDVVQVTGSTKPKPMDRFGNGYGDWNLSWEEWLEGSALGIRTGA
ncbi:L,D-transpeptidase [Streptomyces roseoverticillatus]|uniref:L,D-transpeptidase n=1 Tax=Streptomyces roseoverticillatus TaxID=66429 RepID=UPI001F35D60C|nr:L,D-transpeptidase [Streptomyces roseoverticillatus]MCF3103897.1 L,D-transpeptidase [Streptomyces roseoverticillatus]